MRPHRPIRITALVLGAVAWLAGSAGAQPSFVAFESGPVRPLALSPNGDKLYAVNTPDNRLEIFDVNAGSLTHTGSVPVGMEPVAVAALDDLNDNQVWVVNHLSDSVSIVDVSLSPPQVVRTLLVGDEPRDIVFAGSSGDRAFITTAHRGQHRTDPSLDPIAGLGSDNAGMGIADGDPRLTTEGIGRADVWVFDATSLGTTVGGTPAGLVTFFADTPRALAVSADGNTVYAAAFHSGNQTTAINEIVVCDGFGSSGCTPGTFPVAGPSTNKDDDDVMVPAPETGVIVKFDGATWRDVANNDWGPVVQFSLPDHDVFSIDANSLLPGTIVEYDHVGTILFNMVVHPSNGKIYVTNTELRNDNRFEGPGDHGLTTVQGHLSETRITVIDPAGPSVSPKHLNQHIDYSKLHTDNPDLVDTTQVQHSLATPLQPVVSSDGNTLYVAAFGSARIGVFDTADIEDPSFALNFDPTAESANYIPTGGGPAGLVLDEANGRLYVLTRFDNAVAVIDPGSKTTLETHGLHNPEPAQVVAGRPILYDAANTSGNGEASCASCHIFADFDSLAWNLGNPDDRTTTNNQPSGTALPPGTTFHPMKGPMTTQTLRGLGTHGGMHWRGDRVDGFFGTDDCSELSGAPCDEEHSFMNFIVAFEGLVGHDGPISLADMQKFTDFVLELLPPPNPIRPLDNTLTGDASDGETLFSGAITDTVANCNGCHRLDPSQGFFGSGGEQSQEGEPQTFKVAHLRNIYTKVGMFGFHDGGTTTGPTGPQVRGFGMLHDGSVDTVSNFLSSPVFTLNGNPLTLATRRDLEAFMLAFPSDLAPIVGQQVTLDSLNGTAVNPRIDLMIARATAPFTSLALGGMVTECDLVVKGSFDNAPRGWVLAGGVFLDDVGGSIGDVGLRALATSEGPLTYTCAPPGSGTRMGIDRDEDVLLDGVETNTGVFVDGSDTGTNPALADTDGDGFDDGVEVSYGTDPNNPLSFPSVSAVPHWGLALLVAWVLAAGAWLQRRPARLVA